jgi:single-strand DNA-binding protein
MTKNAEVRYTQSNKAVAQFSLAVNRPGNKETDFINIIAWDKLGEIIQKYTHKGSLIAVEGRLQTRTYEDNNGNKKYITEVVANNINLLEPKNKQEQPQEERINNGLPEDNLDIPF